MIAAVVLLIGAGSAQAITVSKPDIGATVTASVKPTRLPARGAAPITVTVAGTITRADISVPSPLHAISLLLDRQLTVTTAGLPTCTIDPGEPLAYARKHCGGALLGSGAIDETFTFPEGSGRPPSDQHSDLLFFNSRRGVQMYVAIAHPAPGEIRSTTVPFGNGRRLSIRVGAGLGSTASFRFRLGRTWRDNGKQRSYLSGRCATGTLNNQVTLSFSDGDVSEATPQRCTKAGR